MYLLFFWLMALKTRDLSQAKKRLILLQAEQIHKLTTILLKMVEDVILAVAQLVIAVIFSQLVISHFF